MGGGTSRVFKKAETGLKRGFNRLGEVDPFRILPQDKGPKGEDLPDVPTTGTEADRLRQQAILDRVRRAAFTGKGRAATIATGGQGVTARASTLRRTLTGTS